MAPKAVGEAGEKEEPSSPSWPESQGRKQVYQSRTQELAPKSLWRGPGDTQSYWSPRKASEKLKDSTPLNLAGESLCGNSGTDVLLSCCQGTDIPFANPFLSYKSEEPHDSITCAKATGKVLPGATWNDHNQEAKSQRETQAEWSFQGKEITRALVL